MSKIYKIFAFLFFSAIILPMCAADTDWKATASSSEENYSAQLAIDGDPTTRWSSQFQDNQWWIVDFGKPIEIKKITLYWEAAYAKDYKILASINNKALEEVYRTSNGKGGTEVIKIAPLNARYVKLVLNKRGAEWGNSLWEVKFNEPDPIKAKATASSGDGDYRADFAIDGNMQTRWSSNFEDNQWWQADFETPQKICGVIFKWETAFTEKYNIEVQDTAGKWKKVYETEDGDGNTDIIYFEPVEAKALKINCVQRGTGWGNSLWEVTFLDGNNPPSLTASKDGTQFDIKLPNSMSLGGIILRWGDPYPKAYSLEISPNGKDWKEVFKTDKGNGNQDWIYFSSTFVRQLRVNCAKVTDGTGFVLKGFELKSGEEQTMPIKTYQAMAKDSPPGYYPMWLRRIQEFWTIVGVPGDNEEGLLTETGTFEPCKNGFSAMPFIYSEGKIYTAEDCKISQSLVEDYLPIPSVKWDHGNWTLEITALAFGQPGQSMSALRYTFKNPGKEPFAGKFAIAVRPVQVNPIWQHGGFSAINSAECLRADGVSEININGQRKIVSLTSPAKMAAIPLIDGDAVDFIKKGVLPDSLRSNSVEGGISVGLLYDLNLPAGEKKDVVVLFPFYPYTQVPQEALSNAGAFFEEESSASAKTWRELLNRLTIAIPEERLINVMKSNIAYIFINEDSPWIKPGSRNYSHSWMRDGALTSVALLRMGMAKEVRDWVDAVTSKVGEDGFVPFIIFEGGNAVGFNANGSGEGNEYDSQGEYVFAIRQYIDYSGDKQYLQKVYPKVVKALQFAQQLRRQTMTPEFRNDPKKQPYYGILPKSNSHEGYYPAMTSYWDDFFVLRGFKDGVYLANLMGRKDDAEWMQKEVEDFRKCIYDSIRKVAARDKINYIAGCVEKGDFDPTSTAIAIVAGGELDYMPKDLLKNTFDRYFEDFSKGMVPGQERTFTPYEVRSANAYVRMGQRDRGLTMLRYFTKDSVRPYGWNHMAEVVHANPRTPSYIGDMPHTWVGSGYIDAVRTVFVYENDDRLVLGAGLDPAWFDKGVTIKDLPTIYGKINYSFKKEGDVIKFSADGKAHPPAGFVIPLPEALKAYKAEGEGQAIRSQDGNITFSKLPVMIRLTQ
jgi:hypothetical protein